MTLAGFIGWAYLAFGAVLGRPAPLVKSGAAPAVLRRVKQKSPQVHIRVSGGRLGLPAGNSKQMRMGIDHNLNQYPFVGAATGQKT